MVIIEFTRGTRTGIVYSLQFQLQLSTKSEMVLHKAVQKRPDLFDRLRYPSIRQNQFRKRNVNLFAGHIGNIKTFF